MSQKIDLNKILEEIKSEAVITQESKTHLSQSDIRLMRKKKKPATVKSAESIPAEASGKVESSSEVTIPIVVKSQAQTPKDEGPES